MRVIAFGMLVVSILPAAAAARDESAAPRYALRSASIVESAPASSGRYTMRARLAPEASAGELREGGSFTLIGRLAKGAVICSSGDAIFRNGFEQP